MTGVPPPGVHGGDGARVAKALGLDVSEVLDLSASLNPVAPVVSEVVLRNLDAVGRYPDVGDVTAALADALGVDRNQVLLTNGGAEAIALVAAEVGGTVEAEPDFSLYPRGAAPAEASAPGASGPLWRSNPQSPSGELVDPFESRWELIGVWDEAFYPLATGRWTSGVHTTGRVVVGSLTKLYACPGLRLGYIVDADAARLSRMRARQPAWAVGSLAAAVLGDLLPQTDLVAWRAEVDLLKRELVAALLDVAGSDLQIESGAAPWVWVHDAAGWRERLAVRGVVVRDGATLGRPGAVRIAVPDAAGRHRLCEALQGTARPHVVSGP